MSILEFDLYIPPDVAIDDNGDYAAADDDKIYKFNTESDDLRLLSFTGMGMPPINYITQHGPYQHGDTALAFRLRPRVIQYVHRAQSCNRTDYWNIARHNQLNLLRPNRQLAGSFNPGRLRKIRPDGSKRDIYAFIETGPIFAPRNLDSWDEWATQETLQFVCHNPVWFDPALLTVEWEIDFVPGLIFYSASYTSHLTFPIIFSGDAIQAFETITYTGTWQSLPTIEIYGPIAQPRIENMTTDEKLELTYNVPAGEIVTIYLDYGNKRVISSGGANLTGTLTTDSNLGTFHIAPDPEATGGLNTISASGSGGVLGVTKVAVKYRLNYIGI